jgi:hypothetical protein
MKIVALTGLVLLAAGGVAIAAVDQTTTSTQSADPSKVCKMVASDQPNTKPFEMCLTRAEWDAKAIADAKDANRIVCHYEDEPGTRLRSRKICQPASAWNARTAGDREQTEGLQMKTCVPGAGC